MSLVEPADLDTIAWQPGQGTPTRMAELKDWELFSCCFGNPSFMSTTFGIIRITITINAMMALIMLATRILKNVTQAFSPKKPTEAQTP